MIAIEAGQSAWFPYGSVPRVAGTEDISSFCVVPWVSKEMHVASKDKGDASELLVQATKNWAKKNEDKVPWSTLSGPMVTWLEECK